MSSTLAQQVGRNVFQIGDTGPIVELIQLALRDRGYALRGTGYFGTATDLAVQTFQRRAGLTGKDVDGVVGPKTAALIDAAPTLSQIDGGAKPAAPLVEVSRPLWLEAGIKLIGTKEMPGSGDNKTIINWAKDEGGDIAAEYTHDSIPWCALFANHCLTVAGLKGTETLWALDFKGKWPAVKLSGPAVGAFAPMVRQGGGHIAMVVGRDQHGNYMCLGGNQSDQVSIVAFSPTRLNQGFWWPASVPPPAKIGFSNLPVVQSNGRVSSRES